MSKPMVTTPSTHLTPDTRGAMLACGLWMRTAYVGVSAMAIAVIQLFQGEWSALSALSTASAGVALTLWSWRRVHAALSDLDETSASVTGATPAAAHR
jgi:hypothetical protein